MSSLLVAATTGDVTKAGKAIGLALGVGLLERLPDPRPPLVDQLLDRAEGVLAEDEERDREAHQGPDHQPRCDLDQRRAGDWHHLTSTKASRPPSRP